MLENKIQEFRECSHKEEKSQYNLVKHWDYFACDFQAFKTKQKTKQNKTPNLKPKTPH